MPHLLVGKTVELKITNNIIEIFHDYKSIAVHMRNYKRGAHTTIAEHMPIRHQKHNEWTPDRFLNWQLLPEQKQLL